ncbi:hypothetical protein [Natronolimnobius baerhuensis]|uniref:Uncharacterized protein n=1 Tax=Natronolimnobius baerhuensis TaxID=253108 RepID=A0A202E5G9_9EURY|nr:hypothetical protein [Natronolimnobius baerhuensis]OVE83479.1 hypothetical protein B2G88_13625 [Natronolimnobius baerhuensis]
MSETLEYADRTFELIGYGFAVPAFAIFAALGVYVLESVVYGTIMGVFAGGGTVLYAPWRLRLSAVQKESDETVPFAAAVRRAGGNAQLAMLGQGLYLGAFAMFTIAFVFAGPNLLVGLAVAVPIAVFAPYVGSTLIERTSHE